MEPLTDEEWQDGEFASHYGTAATTFQVDHKGRIFVTSEGPDHDVVVVLNGARDAADVLRKVIALCSERLSWLVDPDSQ